jgi:hypothetical protein
LTGRIADAYLERNKYEAFVVSICVRTDRISGYSLKPYQERPTEKYKRSSLRQLHLLIGVCWFSDPALQVKILARYSLIGSLAGVRGKCGSSLTFNAHHLCTLQ